MLYRSNKKHKNSAFSSGKTNNIVVTNSILQKYTFIYQGTCLGSSNTFEYYSLECFIPCLLQSVSRSMEIYRSGYILDCLLSDTRAFASHVNLCADNPFICPYCSYKDVSSREAGSTPYTLPPLSLLAVPSTIPLGVQQLSLRILQLQACLELLVSIQ
jgi:hypothetical protein